MDQEKEGKDQGKDQRREENDQGKNQVTQTAEDESNTASLISIPSTSNFFPIFSRKPLIFFKANPPKFNATALSKEVKNPPKKKSKAKAKSSKTKAETETTNTITNYFGAAAANKTSDPS